MSTEIELTRKELQMAAVTGALRVASDEELLSKDLSQASWGAFVEHAGAELAVGKLLGQFVDADAGRVGPYVVRHHDGVYETDADATPIIFVSGTASRYTVEGWLYAHEAKCEANWDNCWWDDCYLVPAEDLHPLEDFPHARRSQGVATREGGGGR